MMGSEVLLSSESRRLKAPIDGLGSGEMSGLRVRVEERQQVLKGAWFARDRRT